MDVCLPEEFLRLTTADAVTGVRDAAEWLGAEAWVTPPLPGARKPLRTALRDDPTWRAT